MINKGGTKELAAKYRFRPNGKWWVVQYIYRGARLVWQAIRSCFGSGVWLPERPWLDNDLWKDNR